MKTAVSRVYTLFHACLPENEQVQKRLYLNEILESQEYIKLKEYEPFYPYFDTFFSKEKLLEYGAPQLSEQRKTIPNVIPAIETLFRAICFGNAMELTEKDIPDFSSAASLKRFSAKLRIEQEHKNITNITKNHFMDLFSEKTVTNPTEALKAITVEDMKNLGEAMKRNLGQCTYCIKETDILAIQNEYDEKISAIKEKLVGIKRTKRALQLKKLAAVGLVILLLTLINSFELLSPGADTVATLLSAGLTVLYFLIG